MNVKEELRNFILKELCVDKAVKTLSDDENLLETGIIDSMSILSLIAYLEEKFGILLAEKELDPSNFESINRIHEIIVKRLK